MATLLAAAALCVFGEIVCHTTLPQINLVPLYWRFHTCDFFFSKQQWKRYLKPCLSLPPPAQFFSCSLRPWASRGPHAEKLLFFLLLMALLVQKEREDRHLKHTCVTIVDGSCYSTAKFLIRRSRSLPELTYQRYFLLQTDFTIWYSHFFFTWWSRSLARNNVNMSILVKTDFTTSKFFIVPYPIRQ